jgi:hypothetical protein
VACVEYNIGKIQVNRYKDNNVPFGGSQDQPKRNEIASLLNGVYDLERLNGRISLASAGASTKPAGSHKTCGVRLAIVQLSHQIPQLQA